MSTKDTHIELLERLGKEVDQLASSEGWQNWLNVATRFRTYSAGNQLLIASQRPDATRVAGYKTWQSLGRQVRKGEVGIRILAPMTRLMFDDDGEWKRGVVGFRAVSVFDISQTDGEPLPELEMPDVVVPDETLLGRLVTAAEKAGLAVKTAAFGPDGVRGWWDFTQRCITLVNSYPVASRIRTLLHELGHAHDPACQEPAGNETERMRRELVAESVAYLVGASLGIELEEASTFYVTAWGGRGSIIDALLQPVLDTTAAVEAVLAPVLTVETANVVQLPA